MRLKRQLNLGSCQVRLKVVKQPPALFGRRWGVSAFCPWTQQQQPRKDFFFFFFDFRPKLNLLVQIIDDFKVEMKFLFFISRTGKNCATNSFRYFSLFCAFQSGRNSCFFHSLQTTLHNQHIKYCTKSQLTQNKSRCRNSELTTPLNRIYKQLTHFA